MTHIDELVKKHFDLWKTKLGSKFEDTLKNALTELSTGYEERIRELQETVAEYDRRIVAVGGVAINSVSREHHDEEVARLNALYESAVKGRQAFREAYRSQLESQRVPNELRANLIVGCDEITGLCRYLRHGGCDSSDLSGLEEGLSHAIDVASEMISMLAAAPKKEGE